MSYDFSTFKDEATKVNEWLRNEYSSIRTGMATPTLLDNIYIDSYGSKMALAHVAGISVEDAKTLRIAPWDKEHIKEIEKAIVAANLGVSVATDDIGLRVCFPDLTTERRGMLIKLVKEKFEQARVSLRSEREKVWNDIQEKEHDGEISEDEKFRFKDELQKMVDKSSEELEEITKRKETEIAE